MHVIMINMNPYYSSPALHGVFEELLELTKVEFVYFKRHLNLMTEI